MTLVEWFENIQSGPSGFTGQRIVPLKDGLKTEDFTNIYNENTYRAVLAETTKADGDTDKRLLLESTSAESDIHGVILLARWQDRFLVQAKGEVGYKDFWSLTATLQSSWYNLRHKKIPYAELIDTSEVYKLAIPQDAGMFYHKVNQYRFIILNSEPRVEHNFYLATAPEIFAAAAKGYVGEHLLQALGLALAHEAK